MIKYLRNSRYPSKFFSFSHKFRNIDPSKENLLKKKIKKIKFFDHIIKK